MIPLRVVKTAGSDNKGEMKEAWIKPAQSLRVQCKARILLNLTRVQEQFSASFTVSLRDSYIRKCFLFDFP